MLSMSNVDYSKFKATLNSIFFPNDRSALIRRNSAEYDEFWSFLEKYQTAHAKNVRSKGDDPSASDSSVSPKFGLPRVYDKRHRLNIDMKSYRMEDYIRHNRDEEDRRSRLTPSELAYFRQVLRTFLDFVQKRKFQKLLKIRSDRRSLPIFAYREEILSAVAAHQVVLVAGDTGCGKSTQLPQFLSEAGYERIAVTQPRRIACLSLAARVSFETLSQFSGRVGYQVRFEKAASRFSDVVFLTEGLLLRQMMGDPQLDRYGVLVLDEVHERHIHTDFLLGVVKCLVRVRSDVKVVLMSATINLEQFSAYFRGCPIVKVPGRLFPIQVEYRPVAGPEPGAKGERLDPEPYLRVMQLIDTRYPEHERGDLLIFVSGMSDIQAISDAATSYAERTRRWIVLCLHSALSVREQDKVFDVAPPGVRKCIVSTNIAETSVTIDGVRFVADSGRVKEMSWDPSAQMQRLQQFWISRASAEQRKGRSGRTGPGVCFRLYAQEDYDALQEYATPEVRRVPLNSLVLQMTSMGLPDVRRFPFIEPPERSSLELAVRYLQEQGALTETEELTAMGRLLAQLPVEVVLGKMLLLGSLFHVTETVLSLAAALSVQSPLTNRAFTDSELSRARRPYESDHGDPLTLLNLYHAWLAEKMKAGGSGSRQWCRRCGLEEQRMYEMAKLRSQFRELLQEHRLLPSAEDKELLDSQAQRSDRKRLKSLRKERRALSGRKRRRMLDFDVELRSAAGAEAAGPEDAEDMDNLLCNLDDLEFRLLHDPDRSGDSRRRLTARETEVLKVVMCSGLYPQLAIADESNSFRRDSEQAFHTKTKPFVLLHPNDFFAANPRLLQPKEDEKVTARDGASSEHYLLAYVSLLETTKPYLMSTLRVPALQSLLLYAHSIDTNADATRLVFDEWLEIRMAVREDAEMMLLSAMQLRTTLDRLLKMKIKAHEGEKDSPQSMATLERILAFKLTDFLCSDVRYTLRRLLAADLKELYQGPSFETEEEEGLRPHATKGGTQLTPYLVHGCLVQETNAEEEFLLAGSVRRVWTCDKCGVSLALTASERLRHQGECQGDEERLMRAAEEPKVERKTFHCEKCGQDLELSKADAIRHARACGGRGKAEGKEEEVRRPFHCDVCSGDFRMSADEVIRHLRECV